MANGLKGFTAAARGLSRNPLGIIALFIVLIYGFACLVTGFAGDFKETERLPLVWFLALFPLAVLGVFGWLVAKHHKKLYGPQDYKREEIFLATIGHEFQDLPFAASQEETDDVDDDESKLKMKREGITETAEDKYFGAEEEVWPVADESPVEREDDAIDAEAANLDLTTPEGRNIERTSIYKRNRNLFLSSVLVPSQIKGQTYDIFIYLVRHKKQDFSDVANTEFFFGKSWRNRIFVGSRVGDLLGVRISAYGPFLCTCRVTFTNQRSVTLYHYVDFKMGDVVKQVFEA